VRVIIEANLDLVGLEVEPKLLNGQKVNSEDQDGSLEYHAQIEVLRRDLLPLRVEAFRVEVVVLEEPQYPLAQYPLLLLNRPVHLLNNAIDEVLPPLIDSGLKSRISSHSSPFLPRVTLHQLSVYYTQ